MFYFWVPVVEGAGSAGASRATVDLAGFDFVASCGCRGKVLSVTTGGVWRSAARRMRRRVGDGWPAALIGGLLGYMVRQL